MRGVELVAQAIKTIGILPVTHRTVSMLRVITAISAFAVASAAPEGWQRGERASPDRLIQYSVALNHNDEGVASVRKIFWDVSNPDSPAYGKHASKEELDNLTAPPPSAITTVTTWLATAVSGGVTM